MTTEKHLTGLNRKRIGFRFSEAFEMDFCMPYALYALAKINGYKDLPADKKGMWGICGNNEIDGTHLSTMTTNLAELGYSASFYISDRKYKKLCIRFPKEFEEPPLLPEHRPEFNCTDYFYESGTEFKKSLHDNLKNGNAVIGLEFSGKSQYSHAIVILGESGKYYWMTDTKYALYNLFSGNGVVRVLKHRLERSLYEFLTIEKSKGKTYGR